MKEWQAPQQNSGTESPNLKVAEPWYRKKRWWIVALLALVFLIGVLSPNGSGEESSLQMASTSDRQTIDTGTSADTSIAEKGASESTPLVGPPSMSLSEAFCSDLRKGSSLFQLYRSDARGKKIEDFADDAYAFAAISCPDELRSNAGLRSFLDAWGINPDA